jgi:hypothetical protein
MKKSVTLNVGMKAVKPWVKMMRTLKNNPYQEKNGCHVALYGRVSRDIPRAFKALINAR